MYYLNTSESFNCYSVLYYEFLTIPVRKHAYSVCKEHWPKSFVLIVMHDLMRRWLQPGLPCKELSTKHLRFFEYFLKTVWHHHFTGLTWSHMLFCFQKSQLCLFQLRKNVYGKSSNKLKINSVLLKHVTTLSKLIEQIYCFYYWVAKWISPLSYSELRKNLSDQVEQRWGLKLPQIIFLAIRYD